MEDLRFLGNLRDDALQSARDTEAAIAQGYRLHQSCKEIYVPSTSECHTDIEGVTRCTQSSEKETVCEDLPVAIDGTLEKEKLKNYQDSHKQYSHRFNKKMRECKLYVRPLSAQEAFDYYQRVR